MPVKKSAVIDCYGVVVLDENGHEVPDPTPLEIPAGFKRPETLAEQVQRLVRTSVSEWAARNQEETFEESEDFDVGDDDDPASPYETVFDPVLGKDLSPDEFRRAEAVYRDRFLKAQENWHRIRDLQEVMKRAPGGVPQARGSSPAASGGAGGGQPPASTKEPSKSPEASS